MFSMKRSLALLAILALAIPCMAAAAPSYTWTYSPLTGNYYAPTPVNVTWTEARALAIDAGGYLACIGSAEENDWVFETYRGMSIHWWIGFSLNHNSQAYEWESGEPVVYTNWQPGEPNNLGGSQFYAVMDYRRGDWDDEGNDQYPERMGIIERIGATTSTEKSSWGSVKTLFR